MYLYLYFSDLYEKVTNKYKNWSKDLTLNETKAKKKFKNKKRLGSFRLMFPKCNNTNISIFATHIYHFPKLACFGRCKMIGGNFKAIDFGYLVYKMLMDTFFVAEPIELNEFKAKDIINKIPKKFRKYQLVP